VVVQSPPASGDGGLWRSRFASALLPEHGMWQAVLDLPPLRPGTALLQPAVPPTSLSATAAPRQPSPPTKHRRTTRSSGSSARVSPTPHQYPRDGSRFPSFFFPLQDPAAGRDSHARPAPESASRVLRLASLHRLRPTGTIHRSLFLKWRCRMLNLET